MITHHPSTPRHIIGPALQDEETYTEIDLPAQKQAKVIANGSLLPEMRVGLGLL